MNIAMNDFRGEHVKIAEKISSTNVACIKTLSFSFCRAFSQFMSISTAFQFFSTPPNMVILFTISKYNKLNWFISFLFYIFCSVSIGHSPYWFQAIVNRMEYIIASCYFCIRDDFLFFLCLFVALSTRNDDIR